MSLSAMKSSSFLPLGLIEIRADLSVVPVKEMLVSANLDNLVDVPLLASIVDLIFGHILAINSRKAGMHPQMMETSISIKLHMPAST